MRLLFLSFLLSLPLLTPPGSLSAAETAFTLMEQVPSLNITSGADPYPGGRHELRNMIDGDPRTEYSSDGKGTNTFIEFDFDQPQRIIGFKHIDRNDPAFIAGSELTFFDAAGQAVASIPVVHVNQKAGLTVKILPAAVRAQKVRWQVTRLGAAYGTVGGAEIAFYTAGKTEKTPSATRVATRTMQLLERKGSDMIQPLQVTIDYPYAEPVEASLKWPGLDLKPIKLTFGSQTVELPIRAVETNQAAQLQVEALSQTLVSVPVTIKPVRKMDIYVLPHSHVDIGYTALQADVVKKQNENLETGLRLAQTTASYPEGSRFKWNVEVLWPVDNYLSTASPEKRAAFIAAVKSGQIGLDAFYGNILTGLCRPEELLRLMSYATRLSAECGVPVESAMISDVPGYTWSTVSAMAQAGVRYLSFAPNYFDRMGATMKEWQNKPFWWKGQDGTSRVLCWCPSRGYALGHLIGDGEALAKFIPGYLVELRTNRYPYAVSHLRWNVHGDNGSPDEKVADVIRDWNLRYVSPRLIISTTAEAFREFERRYGNSLPEYSGDYTPYWEDGAASSALETAENRASAERLVQAETLWAMRNPGTFPAADFQEAWKNVLLYSEHTWGAHNSISEPDIAFVRDQWSVKQGFAINADKQSRSLLGRAMETIDGADGRDGIIDVFNTSSWERTDLVTLSPELSSPGDKVTDARGRTVPSQRLSTGELVFLARKVPPFSGVRFRVETGSCPKGGRVKATGTMLEHPAFKLQVDEQTGGIASWYSKELGRELVSPKRSPALNEYFYLPGSNLKDIKRNGQVRISIKESGPLIASLAVESEAPGCKRLVQEVRVIDGLDHVELINTVDKLPVRTKEGLHFGYGFDIPDATLRLDVGWAVVRPEVDQIPASCKNWFSAQRWVDISNSRFGVTWCPVDAPLVQVGEITANLIGSQTDYRVWIDHLTPSPTLFSWVMNNHWHTNYRADQEGPTVFRFVIRPHKGFDPGEAARFGISCSQPLLAARASAARAPLKSLLRLSSDTVCVTALKPSDDGKATIVRLFGASGKHENIKLAWKDKQPHSWWLSDTSEQPKRRIASEITVPAWGIVTLRSE